eukprot:13395718-Ditylum_brightwellii.AAC.1
MGAPNELLTDNSTVQAGQQFTDIDWKIMTLHFFYTPYYQNQNPSKRKLQSRTEFSTESTLSKNEYDNLNLVNNTNLLPTTETTKLFKKCPVINAYSNESAPQSQWQHEVSPSLDMDRAMVAQQTDVHVNCVVHFNLSPQEINSLEEKDGMGQDKYIASDQEPSASSNNIKR